MAAGGGGAGAVVRSAASAVVFSPLDGGSRSDAVARRLADGIALGLLDHEAQLPSEAELATAFGVSTVTVREALSTLRARGLVRTQRGRGGGSFVTAPEHPVGTVLGERLAATSPSELRDLADALAAVVGAAARLAADRASEEEVAALRRSLDDLHLAPDAAAGVRAQSRLGVEVAAASQSARLTRAVVRLQAEAGPLLWPAAAPWAAQRWRDLVEAVAAGDGDAARAVAEAQVSDSLRHALRARRAE